MSDRFISSCGDWPGAEIGDLSTYPNPLATFSYVSTYASLATGRNGKGLASSAQGESCTYELTFPDSQPTWTVEFAVKFIGAGYTFGRDDGKLLVGWFDGSTEQCGLHLDANGKLYVTGNGGRIATAPSAIPGLAWTHIQFGVTIGTSGSYWVRNDSADLIAQAAGNTQNTVNAYAAKLRLAGVVWGDGYVIDDLVIRDGQDGSATQGEANIGFVGDNPVRVMSPNGAGSNTNGTPSSGANWECVADGDAGTYVAAGSPMLDTYAYPGSSEDAAPRIVQVSTRCNRDALAACGVAAVAYSSGSEGDSAAATPTTSDGIYTAIMDVDPHTGLPWTKAGFDAAEWGWKRVAA